MKYGLSLGVVFGLFFASTVQANDVEQVDDRTARLKGESKLASADMQAGGATKKGPAAKLLGTGKTAMAFHVMGKRSEVQETYCWALKKR